MVEEILERLKQSPFRAKFKLSAQEREYAEQKGLAVIREHAVDFIDKRLASAYPDNDGKQTPMRHHPVFVAQHATATCCRQCLQKWHKIKPGVELTSEQKDFVVELIMAWIEKQIKNVCPKT